MIIHHFKRHFNHTINYIVYALLIVYFIISGMQLSTLELSDLSVNIGVVDNAENTISKQYVEDLSNQNILNINATGYQQGLALLEREILDLLIVIPEQYTADNKGDKIGYYYLRSNVIAPAALDLLAIDLMPHVIEKRLITASKIYDVGDDNTAKTGFRSYINSLSNNFSVDVMTVGHASQIREEQAIITLNNAKNSLSFSLFFIVLVAVLPLSLHLKTDIETRRRLSLSKNGIVSYYFNEHITSYFYLFPIWSVAVIALANAIQLNRRLTLFLLLSGFATLIVYYELFRLLLNKAKQGYISSLLALLIVILPAILGGVFFDSNLLPTKLFNVVRMLPFNAFESAFYNGLSPIGLNISDVWLLIIYLALAIILLLVNIISAKRIT